jgi:MFS family permease
MPDWKAPLLTLFGSLSDRIGRKKLMMAGCLLAVIGYIPIYKAMVTAAGNNVVAVTSTKNQITGEYKLTAATYAIDQTTGRHIIDPETGRPKLEPAKEATNPNMGLLILLVFIQMIFVGMAYGPIAAYLVEAFPAKVRYTSLSLPYHIGNGVFGGLLPTIGLASCAYSGNILAGLYYPMIVAGLTFVVGSLLLKETKDHRIWDELDEISPVATADD